MIYFLPTSDIDPPRGGCQPLLKSNPQNASMPFLRKVSKKGEEETAATLSPVI